MNLSVFDFDGCAVRVAGTSDAPLFVVKDVCCILDLSNPTVAIGSLDSDERAKLSLGRQGETNVITESGLYHLIFKSRKDAAKKFRRWVTGEVLPALRQKGRYELAGVGECKSLPDWLGGLGLDLSRERGAVEKHCKRAWDAAKLLGCKPARDAESGFSLFPENVLDLAEAEVEAKEVTALSGMGGLVRPWLASDRLLVGGSVSTFDLYEDFKSWCMVEGYDDPFESLSLFVRAVLSTRPDWREKKRRVRTENGRAWVISGVQLLHAEVELPVGDCSFGKGGQ